MFVNFTIHVIGAVIGLQPNKNIPAIDKTPQFWGILSIEYPNNHDSAYIEKFKATKKNQRAEAP
jgi:hypothetical protein